MKVLVVTTSYPQFPGDGAGGFVETRVARLRAQGASVEVLAAAGPDVVAAPGVLRVPGGGLFYAGGAPEAFDRAPLSALLAGAVFWSNLLPILATRLPAVDRVESHWLLPAALAVVALGHRGPHRAHAHSGDVALLERMPGGAALGRRLLAAGLTPVFASEDLRARFARLVGPPAAAGVLTAEVAPAESALVVAPPGRCSPADAARFAAARGVTHQPVVLGVGRLVPIKGYDRLVRAVGRLPAGMRPAVVLLGEGPERAHLLDLAGRRNVALHLPGAVSATEVGGWLGAAAVFVHPARRLPDGRTEGSPVAVSEALAAGIPVVATSTGGVAALGSSSRSPASVPSMGTPRFTLLQDREGSPYLDDLADALHAALPIINLGAR